MTLTLSVLFNVAEVNAQNNNYLYQQQMLRQQQQQQMMQQQQRQLQMDRQRQQQMEQQRRQQEAQRQRQQQMQQQRQRQQEAQRQRQQQVQKRQQQIQAQQRAAKLQRDQAAQKQRTEQIKRQQKTKQQSEITRKKQQVKAANDKTLQQAQRRLAEKQRLAKEERSLRLRKLQDKQKKDKKKKELASKTAVLPVLTSVLRDSSRSTTSFRPLSKQPLNQSSKQHLERLKNQKQLQTKRDSLSRKLAAQKESAQERIRRLKLAKNTQKTPSKKLSKLTTPFKNCSNGNCSSTCTSANGCKNDFRTSLLKSPIAFKNLEAMKGIKGSKIHSIKGVKNNNAVLLEVNGKMQLFVKPEYKGYRSLTEKIFGKIPKGHHVDHVASKAIEKKLGQGYVRVGIIPAKPNMSHGNLKERQSITRIAENVFKQQTTGTNAVGKTSPDNKLTAKSGMTYATKSAIDKMAHRIAKDRTSQLLNKDHVEKYSAREMVRIRKSLLEDKISQRKLREAMSKTL